MCGFPQTVHGGLTAALVDETLGGLAVALWRSGQLGFRPPAYTARLEVDYKRVRGRRGEREVWGAGGVGRGRWGTGGVEGEVCEGGW